MYSPKCNTLGTSDAQIIRKKIVADLNQIRQEEEILTNTNGVIRRQIRIRSTPRTRNRKHVSFAVGNVPLSNPIDRMPTPFSPEIRFVKTPRRKWGKHNVSKKRSKTGSKKGSQSTQPNKP